MNLHHLTLSAACLLLSYSAAFSQKRVSADIEVKQVVGKQVVTITKSVYCSNNGRLVIWVHTPQEYYIVTNALGETALYMPRTNEVMTDRSGAMNSSQEPLSVFLMGRVDDLGVGLEGYALTSTSFEDGVIKKTFTSNKSQDAPTVEIVYDKNYLPIYSAFLNPSGQVLTKKYLAHYSFQPRFVFPERITDITYGSGKDSTIVRNIYTNIKVDSSDPMFDFEIPSDAKEASMPSAR